MNKTRQLIKVFLITLVFAGCDSFLSVNPQGVLTQEAFPETAEDALLATNAMYSTLRNWHYHTGGFPLYDIMSDDAHKGSNPDDASNTVGPFDTFTHAVTQDGLDRWWNALYQGIRRTNVVLNNIPELEMDETVKNRYLAEASFLRALYYFDLVRGFGGVPIVTSTEPDLKVPRSTADDVYALIEQDLEFAIQYLPQKSAYSSSDVGRASKGAAQALLAKVYMFQQDFTSAEPLLLAVINSNEYGLETNFEDANGVNGEQGIESVFEIGALGTSSGGNQYANTQGVRGTPNRGWGFNRPSIDLRDAFENNDPRQDATIIELGDVLDGITIVGDGTTPDETTDGSGTVIEIESYNQKVWYPGSNTDTQFGHNRRLIRYADVLLMAAEVLNENNKQDDALVHLNKVRERARGGNNAILPDVTTTNQAELSDAIMHERRVELALEGHRFWDLVRTGRAATVLGPLGFVTGKHELMPIPQSEIDLSQGSLTQNPNWN